MSDERRGYHRTSTRAIFDNYCLSQPFADAFGCKSRDQVIRATGPKSHHPPDGTIRPIRPCRWRTDKPKKQAGANQEPAYHPFISVDAAIHGPIPYVMSALSRVYAIIIAAVLAHKTMIL